MADLSNVFAGKGVPLRFAGLSIASALLNRVSGRYSSFYLITMYMSLNFAAIAFVIASKIKGITYIIGKNTITGQIPAWSYAFFWPFHLANRIFALVAKNRPVALANEIFPNYYVGCWHAYEMDISWEAVLDLTCELPKKIKTRFYLNLPSWDGQVDYDDVKKGIEFVLEHAKDGPVLIHCAHGVGRSTTFMRAALVEAGFAADVDEAFKVIKAKRSVAKSSSGNQAVLDRWQHSR